MRRGLGYAQYAFWQSQTACAPQRGVREERPRERPTARLGVASRRRAPAKPGEARESPRTARSGPEAKNQAIRARCAWKRSGGRSRTNPPATRAHPSNLSKTSFLEDSSGPPASPRPKRRASPRRVKPSDLPPANGVAKLHGRPGRRLPGHQVDGCACLKRARRAAV